MKRATKKETETRVAHAAELVLEGQVLLLPLLPKNIIYPDVEQGRSLLMPIF